LVADASNSDEQAEPAATWCAGLNIGRNMNRREFLIVGSVGVAGAGFTMQGSALPKGLTQVQERKPMPAFALPDIAGKIVRSSDFTGNVVILRFWATWWTICKAEMPSVQRAYDDLKGKNLRILAISIDAGGAKDVKPFLAEHRYTTPVALDSKMEVFAKYGLRGTPGTFIVDRQGMVVASSFGPVDFDPPEFRKYILSLAWENMRSTRPPALAAWLLRHFGCSRNNDAVIGDLDERYGRGCSRLWWWQQAAATIVSSCFKEVRSHKLLTVWAVYIGWGIFWISRYGLILTRELLLGPRYWTTWPIWITMTVTNAETVLSGIMAADRAAAVDPVEALKAEWSINGCIRITIKLAVFCHHRLPQFTRARIKAIRANLPGSPQNPATSLNLWEYLGPS
jgi:peroxiredoxin